MSLIGGLFAVPGLGGVITLIVFYWLDGTRGPNRFGPDPRDPGSATDLADVIG